MSSSGLCITLHFIIFAGPLFHILECNLCTGGIFHISFTGNVAPLKQQPSREDGHHELFIIAMIHENLSLYLSEICQAIYETTGVIVTKERCIEFRTAFMAHVLQFP